MNHLLSFHKDFITARWIPIILQICYFDFLLANSKRLTPIQLNGNNFVLILKVMT